ncbi:Toprim domain-containing protein [Rhizobiales bacterium GAS191]|nr:Toprim domain-containing protein [Rhizobiales bacterium GAS191]
MGSRRARRSHSTIGSPLMALSAPLRLLQRMTASHPLLTSWTKRVQFGLRAGAKSGIMALHGCGALRFHPRCYHWTDADSPSQTWPALIAKVTDLAGEITGAHRTWLSRDGSGKAPLHQPRRAMGHLLGHGVRFGVASDVMAAGEGIETMLSLRSVLPKLPVVAALSANHLSVLALPPTLRRLYVARDDDADGQRAAERLCDRARAAGVEAHELVPMHDDLNADLRDRGAAALSAHLRAQLVPDDAERFMAELVSGRS